MNSLSVPELSKFKSTHRNQKFFSAFIYNLFRKDISSLLRQEWAAATYDEHSAIGYSTIYFICISYSDECMD